MSNREESRPVAQTLSTNERITRYDKDKDNIILFSNDESKKNDARIVERDLLSKLASILTSKGAISVYLYFLEHGASFASEIIDKCNLSEANTYRVLKRLYRKNLIVPVARGRKLKKTRGVSATIYQIEGASDKEISNAFTRCMEYNKVFYGYLNTVYQRTLKDVIDEEIQYSKIYAIAKKAGNYGFHFTDIADEIARKLTFEGIKVWK